MRTTLDLVDILWQFLASSDLKDQLSGGIYKYVRPVNSAVEDVVISSLPIVNLDLQQAVCNVNVFVPNKTQLLNGVQDISQPDSARLKMLTDMAVGILSEHYGDDYSFEVQQQVTLPDEVSGGWFSNIRINFFSINTN